MGWTVLTAVTFLIYKHAMLILIAESKTIAACGCAVSREEYVAHSPLFGVEADNIMDSLRGASVDLLASDVKISPQMARKLQQMIYEFPNKNTGGRALESFTGVVFKAFDYPTLTPEEQGRADARVRIISSLYGWLLPGDIIKAYRFDFTTPLAPEGKSFAAYWQPNVTDALLRYLGETGEKNILNILPGDAARCIDWKAIGKHARVWKADFQELLPGGKTRTPNAGRLKTLRGKLLRQIIADNITDPQSLLGLCSESYVGMDRPEADGSIVFHTV